MNMAESNPPRSVPGEDNKFTTGASHPEDRKVARGVYRQSENTPKSC